MIGWLEQSPIVVHTFPNRVTTPKYHILHIGVELVSPGHLYLIVVFSCIRKLDFLVYQVARLHDSAVFSFEFESILEEKMD